MPLQRIDGAKRRMPLRLVIFDCDGVLIDSEPVANRVCRPAELTRVGWPMTAGRGARARSSACVPRRHAAG